MKRILRSGLGATLAGVLLLSVLFGGVAWAGLDDETTEIPTVSEKEPAKDPVKVDPAEDETHVISIAPGVSSIHVLYEWTASTPVNDQKIFSSNLLDDSDVRQRWNESAFMYTQQETKQVMLHSFLNERKVDEDGVAYGLSEKTTTTEYDLKTEKVGVERKEDRYGRTAVDNLAVDFYVSEELKGMQAVGLSFVYAYKPDGNGLNPANSGLLRVYVSKDGKTWSEDYVSARSAHILGSGTTEHGESVIYYQVYSENLLDIQELSINDKIMMLRIMPDGEAGIAAGDFSINSLTLTGYGVMSDFVKAVPPENVDEPDTDACRAMVVDAVKSSKATTDLGKILDGISLVTRVAPETIPAMLDTVGLRLMDGISIHATQSVMQLLQWVKDLRADDLDQILSDHEEITTTQKLLQDLNTPQQVFKAYAACKPGDLLVQITETGAKAYVVVKSEPIWNDGGDVVVYDDAFLKNDPDLPNSELIYLDASGVQKTGTFFNLYKDCFAPMVVDVLADDAVQPVRVDGHVSIADGVRVAVSSNFDIEKIVLSMGDFETTVTDPGLAEIYTSEELDTLVAELEPGKYEMTATVYSRCYNKTPVDVPLEFEVRPKAPEVTFTLNGLNLRLQDLLRLGFYFNVRTNAELSQVGALLWTAEEYAAETDFTVNSALAYHAEAGNVQSQVAGEERYVVETEGLHAQYLDTEYYVIPYAKTVSGDVVYGEAKSSSALLYAELVYTGQQQVTEATRSIIIDLLNYATRARTYFGYSEGVEVPATPLNAILSEADKALAWDDSLQAEGSVSIPTEGTYDPGVRGLNTNLAEAIRLNFIFSNIVDGGGIGYWTEEEYAAQTEHNQQTIPHEAVISVSDGGNTVGSVTKIYSYDIYSKFYVMAYDDQGDYSNIYRASVASYLTDIINKDRENPSEQDLAMVELAKAMLIYGDNAKNNPDINKGSN